jgi:aminomethyltransferase
MDVARIEAGLIMLDVEYTPATKALAEIQASSPFELGLGWAVHLKKPAFIGRQALVEEKLRGPGLVLIGIEIDHVAFERAHEMIGLTTPLPFTPWREVVPLFSPGARQVGHATCGTWSPTVKKYIALAQVEPTLAAPGTQLAIDLMVDRRRESFAATVVPLPFFKPERKTA